MSRRLACLILVLVFFFAGFISFSSFPAITPAHKHVNSKQGGEYLIVQNSLTSFRRKIRRSLSELKTLRKKAHRSEEEREKALADTSKSKSQLRALYHDLSEANDKLSNTSPYKRRTYSALVAEHNSLISQIKELELKIEALQERVLACEREAAAYRDTLVAFKKNLLPEINALVPEDESIARFFEKVKDTIRDMSGDFSEHSAPYKKYGNRMVVNTLLNGTVSARLIVDTGASIILLDEQKVTELGIRFSGKESFITVTVADGREVKARAFTLDTMKVGNAEAYDVEAAVLEDGVGSSEDGLLGMSFLKNFALKIDNANQRLILEEFSPHPGHVHKKVTPTFRDVTAGKDKKAEDTSASGVSAKDDKCTVTGIAYSQTSPSVMVGKKLYELNEYICGGQIVAVSSDTVTIKFYNREAVYRVGNVIRLFE